MKFIILPIILALSACSLTQPLVKPDLPVPAAFPAASGSESGTRAADLGWRAMFGDPRLQRLIELALANNRDLRLAALSVEAAQAQYGIQRSEQLPKIDGMAGAARQRTPAATQTHYSANVALSAFEIDLFGRMQALSDAAFARYLASEQGRRAAQISLVGAVADAYFAERLADEQKQLAVRTLADWRQSLDLARLLKAGHQSSGLEVAQAEGQVASAEADLEARVRALAQAGNALRLLIGAEPPADLPAPLPLAAQPVATRLPAGLPSDLLLR
ncbi:TolC family protein, partial [Chromobacterium vaccinii]|uniref:TolC family protein n=1 Tax=Chromobacterium vaccinii TaxID=1108595 RepID=UPI00326028CB